MGVKDLWSVLAPYAERKPISELRGKKVAIDLAGWVCESLNVVDYFVHPRHHLKNLFFRTCYLIWEDVTPIFVLEGVAPKLKSRVIEMRSQIQFRGAKPKETQNQHNSKVRTRFNHVLKQCENLLQSMGIQCLQGPGEAEAYCAFLNLNGLVDGVISQDSDCFAYGALRVYRNFSVSSQGALAAQGGAVDIYDMRNICSKMDFGQNKVIVMALLCGCDYCPDGIGGVGRDSVLKLFHRYKNDEILQRICSWRLDDDKYSALEMKVNDKSVCSYCGHIGRTQSHTKNGCGICRSNHGCDESLWKEERLSIKAEITLRKKALADPCFPSKEIINEFQKHPQEFPKLQLQWHQPNMIKFIKQIGHLLEWPEIYCFQKFFPIYTRWQVATASHLKDLTSPGNYVKPKEIIKKRVVKGVPSLELLWQDENGIFSGLIPESQLKELLHNNPSGVQNIWSTIEPFDKVRSAYPTLVESFLKSKEKPNKIKKLTKTTAKQGSLENLNDIIEVTKEISNSLKTEKIIKPKKCNSKQGLQKIDRFFKQNDKFGEHSSSKSAHKSVIMAQQCSTPITKNIPFDLESDIEEDILNISDIVDGIVSKTHRSFILNSHKGRKLRYEEMKQDLSVLLDKTLGNHTYQSVDDFDILSGKRTIPGSFRKCSYKEAKRQTLDDSFDVLVKNGACKSINPNELVKGNCLPSFVELYKQKQCFNTNHIKDNYVQERNISYFFNDVSQLESKDAFEQIMETSISK